MTRPTKTFKTSGGHTLELKEYITGKEFREHQAVMLSSIKLNAETIGTIGEISGTITQELDKKAFDLVVISFDGQNDNLFDKVLELPVTDYKEVMDEVMSFFRTE